MAQQQHISFTRLCLTAAQLVYKQLEDMMDVLPKMNNIERKQHIISMALKGRELFYKLAIISDFMAARSKDVYLANVTRGYFITVDR